VHVDHVVRVRGRGRGRGRVRVRVRDQTCVSMSTTWRRTIAQCSGGVARGEPRKPG